jgi:hypothetical protein
MAGVRAVAHARPYVFVSGPSFVGEETVLMEGWEWLDWLEKIVEALGITTHVVSERRRGHHHHGQEEAGEGVKLHPCGFLLRERGKAENRSKGCGLVVAYAEKKMRCIHATSLFYVLAFAMFARSVSSTVASRTITTTPNYDS